MKIWLDILTPKQILFFEPMIERLEKNHSVLCTSRRYSQVTELAKIRKQKLVIIGKGRETYQEISGEKIKYSDIQIIKRIIDAG